MSLTPHILTADGHRIDLGDRCFDYYGMREVMLSTAPDERGWAYFVPTSDSSKRGRDLLNGERVCSLGHARRMGWLR